MSTKFYGNDYDYANFNLFNNKEKYLTDSYQDKFKKLRRDVNNTIVASAVPSIAGGFIGGTVGGLSGRYIGGLTRDHVSRMGGNFNPLVRNMTSGRFLPKTRIPLNPYIAGLGLAGTMAGGIIGHRLALPYTQNNIKNNLLKKTDKYKNLLPNKQEAGNLFKNIAQNRLFKLYGRNQNTMPNYNIMQNTNTGM